MYKRFVRPSSGVRPSCPPLADDPSPPTLEAIAVDQHALDRVVEQCKDPAICAELQRAPHAASRLALVEDSLHHDRGAWPVGLFGTRLQPQVDSDSVRLTLPLPSSEYRAASAYDNFFTRPRANH